jgi:hypothetical protein
MTKITVRNLSNNQPSPIYNNLLPTFEESIEVRKVEQQRKERQELIDNFCCTQCGCKKSDHPMWYGFCMICDFLSL